MAKLPIEDTEINWGEWKTQVPFVNQARVGTMFRMERNPDDPKTVLLCMKVFTQTRKPE